MEDTHITLQGLRNILSHINFKGWVFKSDHFAPGQESGCWLQVRFTAPDNATHEMDQSWSGRKWYISPYSTPDEVVQTCLKAVLTAVEHEAREQFLYKGVAIFQPHVPVEELLKIAALKSLRS